MADDDQGAVWQAAPKQAEPMPRELQEEVAAKLSAISEAEGPAMEGKLTPCKPVSCQLRSALASSCSSHLQAAAAPA